MSLAIGTLLSPQARIVHRRNRLMISKRIVEYDGARYVLHRFRRHATFERFMQLVEQMAEAGASVQHVAARTATAEQQRRHGYWVALDYIPGKALGSEPTAANLVSFGRNLARLHSVEGPEGEALFAARHPKLPHVGYLATTITLSAEERAWIRNSGARLRRVRANGLTHGDLYAGNIIEAPDSSVSLIDYELMAFERAGIELAIALLRPFCRRPADRRLLVETYLAHCSEANAEVWRRHANDFLFAAAARLLLKRKRRRWRLILDGGLLKARARLLPFGRAGVEARIRAHEERKRMGNRRQAYFEHVARAVVRHCLAGTSGDALDLLDRINAEFFTKA